MKPLAPGGRPIYRFTYATTRLMRLRSEYFRNIRRVILYRDATDSHSRPTMVEAALLRVRGGRVTMQLDGTAEVLVFYCDQSGHLYGTDDLSEPPVGYLIDVTRGGN
mgnify:CR=1 FL=1